MSSQSFRRPEFRLLLGYPDVTLTRTGAALPLGRTQPESPDFTRALRGFAAEVARARGRLVVVLPEIEVWRGRPVLAGHRRGARRRDAVAIGADGLGMPPQAVTVVLGATAADGTTPVAAVRRGTLAETRALLAGVGLRPAAIVGDGAFPGFAAPPRLGGWPWRLPSVPRLPRRQLVFGAGAVAAAAALVLALPGEAPAPASLPVQQSAPATELAAARVEPARTEPAAPRALLRAAPPKHRPDNLAAVPLQPIVTQATRNVPLVLIEPRRGAPPELRLAELPAARARMADTAMTTPLRRPAPAAAPVAATAPAGAPEPAVPAPAADGPRHRPQTAAAVAVKATPAPAAATPAARPMPRPAAAKPDIPTLVVASLEPEALIAESLAAAAAKPAARPAPAPLARPAGLEKPAKPAPKVVTPRKPSPPAPKLAAAPVRPAVQAPPRAVTVPVRQASLAAAPAPHKVKPVAPRPVAAKPVAAKPVAAKPVATRPATERAGFRRGNMALIGVFGGSDGRHALIRMPNGAIERVSAGDRVQGVQVAAIGADSVRLNGRGRDTLLKLPE